MPPQSEERTGEKGYCNPLPIVLAVVRCGGKVLVVRRGHFYELPGGKIRCGEPPDHAVEREVREETGLGIERFRLMGALWMRGYGGEPVLALVYRADLESVCRPPRADALLIDASGAGVELAPGTREALAVAGLGKGF